MTYNGWSNRPTWALGLWLDNEYGWYLQAREIAHTVTEEHQGEDQDDILTAVAERLEAEFTPFLDPQAYVDEIDPDITLKAWLEGSGRAAHDIGDLSEVDWREIAAHYLAE